MSSPTTGPSKLMVDNCAVIRPSMAEFQDERAFLASPAVQEAGLRCGIVRVVPPPEFRPTIEKFTLDDVTANPSLWTAEVPVLEQRFPRVVQGPAKGRKGYYVVARRQKDAYPLETTAWEEVCDKWQSLTKAAMMKDRGQDYQLPKDPRKLYWASRPFQRCAFYGADVPQTVMRPEQSCWNFGARDFPCLTKMFEENRTPGVYTPYLYIGSWGSSFGLHPEDKDLYSLNYLHEGASKFWYGMPASVSPMVEKFAAELLPDEAVSCQQFLRHKTLMVEPAHFIEQGIPVFAAEQKAGDLMITFPNAYHYGFNSGFNVAEARNIATEDWLSYGLKAKQCTCPTYAGADVLPYERIVKMAKSCDPVKYADLPVTRPANEDLEEELLAAPVKRPRRI